MPQTVTIIDFMETRIAVMEHRGDPRLIGNSIRRFIEWRRQNHLPPSASATFNILYDDPAEVAPEKFRIDLCAAVDREINDSEYGIVSGTIPAGRCAVLRHIGTEETLGNSILQLCTQWLPDSGEERRDFPIFLQRVRFFPEMPEIEAVTDIFLPIE
ncbi:MAG TPA: GyrI-like domain-containing protein [Chlorobaculum sp.]|nr:GyrI-like domain-containing protein [Chlorobaculum sp.]